MLSPENTRKRVARWTVECRPAMLGVAMPFADATHGPEDIVAKACMVALRPHAEAADVVNPRGRMLAITKSVALQIVRKQTRRAKLRRVACRCDSSLFEFSEQDIHRGWLLAKLRDGRREQVLEIARGLSRALRQVVHNILVDGWDDDEIARHHGITRSAVRRRRIRAVEAILGVLPPRTPEAITHCW